MSRHPLTACISGAACAANATATLAACAHTDDWASWFRRHDAAPCLTLLNAFIGYQLGTVDAGAHAGFATLLTLVHLMAGTFAYVTVTELSIVVGSALGVPWIALRGYWASAEPTATLPLVAAGALLGALYARATRVPPLFTIDPCRSHWRNAKHALQSLLVLVASFYYSNAAGGYDSPDPRVARPEWLAYALTKTLSLAIVYVWNRADEKTRVAVYGADVRTYDAVWARLAIVYAVLLGACACMWTTAWRVAALQCGAGVVVTAVFALAGWRAPPRSAYAALQRLHVGKIKR